MHQDARTPSISPLRNTAITIILRSSDLKNQKGNKDARMVPRAGLCTTTAVRRSESVTRTRVTRGVTSSMRIQYTPYLVCSTTTTETLVKKKLKADLHCSWWTSYTSVRGILRSHFDSDSSHSTHNNSITQWQASHSVSSLVLIFDPEIPRKFVRAKRPSAAAQELKATRGLRLIHYSDAATRSLEEEICKLYSTPEIGRAHV